MQSYQRADIMNEVLNALEVRKHAVIESLLSSILRLFACIDVGWPCIGERIQQHANHLSILRKIFREPSTANEHVQDRGGSPIVNPSVACRSCWSPGKRGAYAG